MKPRKLLFELVFQYKFLILITIILGFVGAIFNGIGTTLIVPIIIAFLGGENNFSTQGPPIIKQIMSAFDSFPGNNRLMAMLAVLLLAIIAKNLTAYINNLAGAYLSCNIVNNLRLQAIRVLLDVDYDFYTKRKVGDLINIVGREVDCAANALKISIKILSDGLTILTFLCLLIILSWQITLISTVLLGLIALSNQFFVIKSKAYGKLLADTSKKYSNKLLEILTGIRLIKNASNEAEEYKKIEKFIRDREKAQLQSQAIFGAIGPINEISGILVVLAIILIGHALFSQQLEAIAPILLTYLVILFRLLPFVGALNNSRSQLANNIPSTEVVTDFLRRDNKNFMQQGQHPYTKLEKSINFHQLTFSYPGHERIVLKGIDLVIPKGKTTALVGASGAGKSTIADLLPRFYDPTSGYITIDNRDLREYDLNSLRQAMGVVSQDTFLFNSSVRYNIAYGLKNVSEEEIIDAAKRANAYEFIVNLEKGFDTEIGDRGVMLSGGQRQRLAIARALLRNPDILILDEATSALDTVSERLVQEAIEELCRDRTTLVIAHRLSTIQKAHQIVVLEKGKIVEIGNHEQLLKEEGYYSRLYSMQFKDKEKAKVILPANEAMIRASLKATYQIRNHLSYELRTSLNAMLGCLRLVSDGIIEDREEEHELIEESYKSALELLNTLELYLNKAPINSGVSND
jgi:subfamily B ATP-binding cassette protein MsbA